MFLAFTLEILVNELEKRAPIVWETIQLLSMSKRKKIQARSSTKSKENIVNVPLCATAAAMLLKSRHPEMSALAYRNGLIIRHSGAGSTVSIWIV